MKDMVASLVKSGLATGFYSPAPAEMEGAANADPWAGIFRRPAQQGPNAFPDFPLPLPMYERQMLGVRDEEDGVYRCLECHHEIAEGFCTNCGREYPGHDYEHDATDFDDDDDEDDDELPAAWAANGPVGMVGELGALLLQHIMRQRQPHHPHEHGVDFLIDDHLVGPGWAEGGGDTEIESDGDYNPHAEARERLRGAARARGDNLSDEEDEEGYESSFIDDGDAAEVPPRAGGSSRRGRAVDLDEDHAIELSDGEASDDGGGRHSEDDGGEEDEDLPFAGLGRRRVPAMRSRLAGIISDDDEDYHDGNASDLSHSHDDDDEDNLADEVAAREL